MGHASGSVAAWDLQRTPPRQLALITGQHHLPVVHVSFFPGRGATMALTVDRRGRLLLHTFTSILLKTAVASRLVLDGNLGTIGSIVHLMPYNYVVQQAAAGQQGGAGAGAGSGGGAVRRSESGPGVAAAGEGLAAATAAAAAAGAAAAAAALPQRVGDGMVAVCATTGCHIGRFKPSGRDTGCRLPGCQLVVVLGSEAAVPASAPLHNPCPPLALGK